MGMWIGRPGALRDIKDGASKFERAPDIAVREFRSLGGAVTTWAPPVQPRRLALSWSAMEPDDVAHLDRLAQRIDGPGPIAVLDPLTRNFLDGTQALGQGAAQQWSVSSGSVLALGGTAPAAVDAKAGAELSWLHPTWPGYPVSFGMTVWWWAPALASVAGATLRLLWQNAAGDRRLVTAWEASKGPLPGAVPADMAYVTPLVGFTSAGVHPIGASVLSTEAPPRSAVPPLGEGCPAMSITGYTHAAMQGNGAYRDIGLTMVEVPRATR
ncbi:hypothetical protein IPZ68_08235 [Streptomyces arenae]|nr:hypothetical protein [Streptomyces arenae]